MAKSKAKEVVSLIDNYSEACGDFNSVVRTLRLLQAYMDSPLNPLPPDKTKEELNRVNAVLAILMSFLIQRIQEMSKELPQN